MTFYKKWQYFCQAFVVAKKKGMSKKDNHKIGDDLKDELEEIQDQNAQSIEVNEEDSKNESESETEELQEALGKEKDKFLRLFAEFENYKRRTGKERLELFKTANQEVLHSLLPVVDDFDRALAEISKSGDTDLLKGVELIYNKFKETLKSKGLVLMEVKEGDVFDPDLHEAVTQIPVQDTSMKGKIVDVIQKGYVLGEKIIRYPKVVTGK